VDGTPNVNSKKGIGFALIASLCGTLMSVFVKLIDGELNVSTIIFARFALGLVIMLPWILTDDRLFIVDNKLKILMRCSSSLTAIVCVFYSLQYLPVANVMLLNNTFPLFIPLLSFALLGLKTPLKMLIGIAIGFIGVALVLHPSANSFNWYAWIALFSGFLVALGALQVRLLTQVSSAKQILFYYFVFGTVASALVMPFNFIMPTYKQLVLLFFVGLFGTGYQAYLTLALTYAKARIVSPIYFTSIMFAVLFDWLIWSIDLHYMEIMGMALIISGGILTMLLAD
jgi:drug/metabolite transporter (DMT)-like permease